MSWTEIKNEILKRHEHAIEHDADEVRVVLGYRDGQRVPLVVRHRDNAVTVIAQVATGSAMKVIAMLRAATSLGIELSMVGDSVCVRAAIAPAEVETTLQSTAAAALRVRRATVATSTVTSVDIGAFAFAL